MSGLEGLSGKPGEGSLSQKSPEELVNLGFSYMSAGNQDLAKLHFASALQRDPQTIWAYVGLGDIDYQANRYPTALAYYQKASSLDEKNLAALLGQAQTLRQQGNPNAAGEQLSRAIKLAPDDVRVLTELAINYDTLGQGNLATPLFQEVAQKTNNKAAAYNNLGINQLFKGEYAEAVAAFSKARLASPTDSQIINNLAMTLALLGDESQALALFRKTVGEAGAWNNIGYLYMTQRRLDDAERALHKAIELSPHHYVKAQENLERLKQMRTNPTASAKEK